MEINKIKKRKYSRLGCSECKRRKIKCDESKPECFNCSRLRKICNYPDSTSSNFKYENPNTKFEPQHHVNENEINNSSQVNHDLNNNNNNNSKIIFDHNLNKSSLPQQLPNSPLLNHQFHQSPPPPPQQQQQQQQPQQQLSYRFYQENNSNIRTPPSINSIHDHSTSATKVNLLDLEARSNEGNINNINLPIIQSPNQHQHIQAPIQPQPQSLSQHQSNIQTPSTSSNTLNQHNHQRSISTTNSILPHNQQPPSQQHLINSNHQCKKYKISDILSPDIDFLNDQNWGSIAPDDVRNLFDDASLLVHDSLEMFGIDQYNNINQPINHNINTITTTNTPTTNTNINNNSSTSNVEIQRIRADSSYSVSIPSSDEASMFPDFPIEEFSSRLFVKSNPILMEPLKSNKELIESTLKHFELSGPHENYLNKLTNSELSFHMFPFAESIENNIVNKILLKYSQSCSYLLTSLLSSSATFQFIQTRKQCHEQNRVKYNSICLKLLSEAFPQVNNEEEDQKIMANDIEKLLLTILVLTSNFTATAYFQKDHGTHKNQTNNKDKAQNDSKPNKLLSWKTHLRGVKDLLIKYTDLTCNKTNRKYISDGLALAKTWYFAIESLAELNDPLGGTLKYIKKNISNEVDIIKTDMELDFSDMSKLWLQTGYFSEEKNKDYHDALIRINLLTLPYSNSVQFNLYNGYSIAFVKLIDEFCKCLDLLRDNNNAQMSGQRISRIMSLIDKGRENDIVPLINKDSFIIPITSPGHPNYKNFDKIELPKSCFGKENIINESTNEETTIFYSWFDWCEQMHIDSLYLKLLTTKGLLKLPQDHALIKELKIKILDSLFFIKPLKSKNQLNHHHHTDKNWAKHDDIFVKSENFYISKNLFDLRVIMVQSVFRQCSKIQLSDEEFEKLELLFRGMIKLGNGSSLIALDQIRKLRNKNITKIKKENDDEFTKSDGFERKSSNGSNRNGEFEKIQGSKNSNTDIDDDNVQKDQRENEEQEENNDETDVSEDTNTFLDIIPFS
ncbi:hypothetical protein KGF54_002562 [Candida jiufengensis]|uniref:uncharacterized protein n=1 Tax=Candida jiufengensis TaxID=497108 RepID=UPI0022243C5C|nr:uncharacterized protein KGF54_002562 [Candida jiufengensis]KAI5953191.1 hypothetical protein KGF54_002562 [Candida jiufengensis]